MVYRKLELALYGIVFAVSVGVGVATERLDYRLQKQTLAAEIAKTNQSIAFRLEAEISQLVAWAHGMVAAVALKPNMEQSEFSATAARLGTDDSIVLNISLATDGVVRRVFPVDRNSLLLGKDLRAVPNQSEGVELAQQTANPVFLGPIDLVQGGRGFILRFAFSPTSEDSGPPSRRAMLSIVVESKQFLEKIIRNATITEVNTTVSRIENGTVIYGNPSVLEQKPIINSLTTPSDTWQIASAPSSGWPFLSSSAPTIAGIALLRLLIACAVLRTIFRLLRKQKATENQLSVAIEALDDGFALFDANDRLVLSNRRYHEIYSTSGDLLIPGATFEEIVRGGVARGQYPDAMGCEQEWIKKRLRSHRLSGSVIEQRLDNGSWLRVVERKTKDGGTVGFRVDITELKLATEAARAAERAKSEFISVLSHELRTPLTIVIGYLSLMAKIGKLPVVGELQRSIASGSAPNAGKQLDMLVNGAEDMALKAHRSAEQLLSLINHLLDFSKVEAGKMRLDVKVLDVSTILGDIDHSFREVVEAKGIMFSVVGITANVRADPIRVRQILTNLVSNAVKFTEEGSIRLEASIKAGKVLFHVQDTGCGIPDEMASKVFERFEQVDSFPTRRAGGTGLGLAISKSLVEMMGGEIGFESTLQSGSTFWFTVPSAKSG